MAKEILDYYPDYPEGWYAILPSAALKQEKKPLGITRFGIPLVLWRDAQGLVHILRDYCPHRGARLSLGKVINDTIACPFHGFQFNGQGKCIFAPEFNSALPGLSAQVFSVHESAQMIWLYYGQTPSEFKSTRLLKLHKTFKRFSLTKKLWRAPIMFAIENQLDYTHLPTVHRTTIGRGYRLPKEVRFVKSATELEVYFDQRQEPTFEYVFPNTWILNTGSKLKLVVFFAPVDSEHTFFYLATYRNFLNYPLVGVIVDKLLNLANRIILKQDEKVVTSQTHLPALPHRLMRHDEAIAWFRALWQKHE